VTATELSGFGLTGDMSDTLVIAISAVGYHDRHEPHRSTRAVARAVVIAIVNRARAISSTRATGSLHVGRAATSR